MTMPIREVESFFESLHFFYDHGCDQLERCGEPGVMLRYLYHGLLPCVVTPVGLDVPGPSSGLNSCLLRHFHFRPSWANRLSRWLEVEHRAYGLGLPSASLPFMGNRPPEFASDFMDAGAAGMWYIFRRGSGIFYDTGRRKSAPGKNAMMVSLLNEVEAGSELDLTWQSFAVREKLMNKSAGAQADSERILSTAKGSKTCTGAGIRACRCKYILGDQWDNVMVWLARRLRYDTLFFTATLLPAHGCVHEEPGTNGTNLTVEDTVLTFVTAYPELVDVRPFNEAMTAEQEKGENRWLIKDARAQRAVAIFTLRKRRNVGERWMQFYREAGRLTLRDPFALGDSSHVRPCDFNYTSRMLQCASHISSQWPQSGFKKMGMVMCGQFGAWLEGRKPPPPPLLTQGAKVSLATTSQGRQLSEATHYVTEDTLIAEVKQYLTAVYPSTRLARHSSERIFALFDSLHFYYTIPGVVVPRRLRQVKADLLPLGATHTCLQPPEGLGVVRDKYRGLLPCPMTRTGSIGGRGGCLERQIAFHPEWARRAASDIWIEVQHAAFGNKGLPPANTTIDWADVVDPGEGGMWYHYARGSGIFYRLGRTLVTPSKTSAVAALLREVPDDRTSHAARMLRVLARSDKRFCPRNPLLCRSRTLLADRIRAVANGSSTCWGAGIGLCREEYAMGDEWDTPLVWLGRALDYDTIFFTASLCCTGAPENSCGISELVDLRAPDAASSHLNPDNVSMGAVDGSRKNWRLANAWIDSMQRSNRLTLRDPFEPAEDRHAMACKFRATNWLGCDGHPSQVLENASPSSIVGRRTAE